MTAIETLLSEHTELFRTVQAWDDIDGYTIAIGDLIWYMPDSLDELCECEGDWLENWWWTPKDYFGKPISLDELPIDVLRKIIALDEEEKCLHQ